MPAPVSFGSLSRFIEVPTAWRQTKDWWQLSAGYAFGRSHRFPLLVRLRSGESVRLLDRGEAAVFWQIFIRGCYEVEASDRVILDAGANLGLFAIWAAREAPGARILSVEPHPATADRLEEAVRANGLTNRIEVLRSALGDSSEPRWLNDAEEGSISSYIDNQDRHVPGRRLVACATLPELMDRYDLRRVDLLKMDIEASEYETLLATPVSVLRRIARVNVELHVPGPVSAQRRSKLLEYMKEAGFRLRRHHPDEHGTGIAYFDRI